MQARTWITRSVQRREPMSDLLPLDRLQPYLRKSLGIDKVHSVKKTASGQSNPTFVLDTSEGPFVLRRKPPGVLLKSAHAVEREFRVMKALNGHLPVPKMYQLCEDDNVIGATFFIMEFVTGHTHDDPALAGQFTSTDRARIYDEMNAGLAQLHQIDPVAIGLEDFGKPGNYFSRQLSRWSAQYEATKTDHIPDMDRLTAWLKEALPEDDGQVALVHGDWRIDNLLFSNEDNRLKAVLDWELSTLGHPLADLGAQLMQWAMPPGQVGRGLEGVDRAELGIPSDNDYVATYAQRVGLQEVPDMTFHVAFAFFRMAAILQGVKKRALDGNASNAEKGLKLGAYVPVLARKALDRFSGAA